MTGLGESSTQT